MSLLEVDQVTMRFGGHVVVNGVRLDVAEGALTGLIGPNGAGKTTLFNAITGLLAPDAGRIRLSGRDITDLPTYKRARAGIGRTFQRLELFTSLTVRQNVQVAGEIGHRWGPLGRRGRNGRAEVDRVLDLVSLGDVADREVGELSTGQARVVELARALMTRPRLLLLDEPASGQDAQETLAFGNLLRRLVGDGVSILLVEHDMSLVMSVCDTIHVLDLGSVIARGAPDEIQHHPDVVDAYLGRV
mgnify:CR=1 FL=1